MNQSVIEISFKCSRGIIEVINRHFDINIILDNKNPPKRIYLHGNIIINRKGIPSLTFLVFILLKVNCCLVFSPGFYVNLLYLSTINTPTPHFGYFLFIITRWFIFRSCILIYRRISSSSWRERIKSTQQFWRCKVQEGR